MSCGPLPTYGEAPVQLKRVPRKLAGVERAGLLVSLALSTDTCCPTLVKVTYPVNGSKGLGKIATQLLMNSGTDALRICVDIDTSGVFIASTSHLLMLLDVVVNATTIAAIGVTSF